MNSIKSQKIEKFLDELSSSSPTPGGGAVAALSAAMAASLVEMVANLTIGKKGYEKARKDIGILRYKAIGCKSKLLKLADDDVEAFKAVMSAYKTKDKGKIRKALKKATQVPFKVKEISKKVEALAGRIAKIGNKNAISDAKSAIYLAQSAAKSADENVKINRKALAALK